MGECIINRPQSQNWYGLWSCQGADVSEIAADVRQQIFLPINKLANKNLDPVMDDEQPGHASPPEVGTNAALSYYWARACDLRLLHFLIDTVLRGDFSVKILKDALEGKATPKSVDPQALAKEDPGLRTRALRESSQELLEMFLSRAVDNFQIYIVDMLREVLLKQPRILSSSKQELTLGYVLQFDSIEGLTRDWIEDKVTALSYKGFGELEIWCQARGIPLLVPDGQRNQIVELLAVRNLIVHRRCVVDDRYKKAIPAAKFNTGEQRTLHVDDLLSALDFLDQVVFITDGVVLGKFALASLGIRAELTERARKKWRRVDAKEPTASGDENAPTGSSGVG